MGKRMNVSLEIAAEKCTGCGRCAAVCPQDVFTMKNHNGKLRSICVWSAKCTACGRCTIMCPGRAIELEVMERIATPAFV